jgi:hypothetical protein
LLRAPTATAQYSGQWEIRFAGAAVAGYRTVRSAPQPPASTWTGRFWGAVVPYWLVAAFSLACPLIQTTSRLRHARRPKGSLCPACGYDLRATPDRCPECGTTRR